MKLYNTPAQKLVELELNTERPIKIYTCGPTVYDYPHIGNWYTFLRYDLLVRTLRQLGYQVNWVMNITDVGHLVSDADEGEDKLEKGARRDNKTAYDVAKFYGDYFQAKLAELNFAELSQLPKATDFIEQQIGLVKQLESKGFTYQIDDGVYFDTAKFPAYADFAHLNLAGLEAGARVEANTQKRNAADFAVWKFSPADHLRDMEWDSPWGKGFPGWHLECSAMIHDLLGEPIDIHGGGIDHIAVHHTNEIAQTVAAYGHPLSRYWFHCNHIQVEGQKMSKSLGNYFTLEDIADHGFDAGGLRLQIFGGHYRSQSEFSLSALAVAQKKYNYLRNFANIVRYQLNISPSATSQSCAKAIEQGQKMILDALEDDLNSVVALQKLELTADQLINCCRLPITSDDAQAMRTFIEFTERVFGLQLQRDEDISDTTKQLLSQLDAARTKAAASHNYDEVDALKAQILGQDGINQLEIGQGGPADYNIIWKRYA